MSGILARYEELIGEHLQQRPSVLEGGALAHYNLGLAFRQKALYDEALRELAVGAESLAAARAAVPQIASHDVDRVLWAGNNHGRVWEQSTASQLFPNLWWGIASGAIAILALLMMIISQWGRDSARYRETAELNQRNQDSILRLLDEMGSLAEGDLTAFPMATGGKGLHLVVPIVRRHPWPIVSGFTKAFAERVAELDPQRFGATMSKAKRKGRIFIDHFRNQRGSTAIAPYSPRAREGGPVAMPLHWDELPDLAAANLFSFSDALERLDENDPWSDYMKTRQSLTATKLKRIGLEHTLSG